MNTGRWHMVALTLLLSMTIAGCGSSVESPGDTGDDSEQPVWQMEWTDALNMSDAGTGELLELGVLVTLGGEPAAGVTVGFELVNGGGTLQTAMVVTDGSGVATTAWTAGPIGGRAVVRASVDQGVMFVDRFINVSQEQPLIPAPFGDVGGLLAIAGIEASTEGLVFDDSGRLILAVSGNLIVMSPDGSAELVPVGGDGLQNPLGMAWDYLRGAIWVADVSSVRKVTLTGEAGSLQAVSATVAGPEGLVTPNSVAIRDNRHVYFTDSCTGGVYRFQPEATPVTLETVAMFDLTTKGGPNGIAFDEGGRLWVTTENVGLLCPDSGADPTLNHGSLYMLDVSGDLSGGPVQPVARLEGFGMFGDGLAFDGDGTMYVVFDRFDGFTLTDSSVWVVPESTDKEPFKVISAPIPDGAVSPDRLIANIAWGYDDFGSTKLYISLLAVVLVTSERGAMVADVGIRGASLLPADLPD